MCTLMKTVLHGSRNITSIFGRNKFEILIFKRNFAENPHEIVDEVALEQDDFNVNEQLLDELRDKSRLRPEHRNILFGCKPYSEPVSKHHFTIKYNRKLYGKYGSESGVNPGIMWPTKSELNLRKQYETVAYPHTIPTLVALEVEKKEIQERKSQLYHDRVVANLAKLDQWKKDLKEKLAKKEAEALAVKEKKERLIEDVRRHFGFKVDPRDERFKEMLALKEKEQKKKEKQTRIQEREKKAIAKLMAKNDPNINNTDEK